MDLMRIYEQHRPIIDYILSQNLTAETIQLLAKESDDDLNGVNDLIFENYLNTKYQNICVKIDAFVKSQTCQLKVMTELLKLSQDNSI